MKTPGSHLTQVIGLLPGVDIKVHPNNYVLVPPSTTEKSEYRWLNTNAALKKRWTGEVLDNIVTGAPEGCRNDYLTRLCGQMIYAGAESETVWILINYAN